MKKTISTITLAAVMTLGATFANATGNTGIIVAGSPTPAPCSQSTTGTVDSLVTGFVAGGIYGIIVAGAPDPGTCTTSTDGIIVAG